MSDAESNTNDIKDFGSDNKKNHDRIEELFVASNLMDKKLQEAIIAFLEYNKPAKYLLELPQFQEYHRRLRMDLDVLPQEKKRRQSATHGATPL